MDKRTDEQSYLQASHFLPFPDAMGAPTIVRAMMWKYGVSKTYFFTSAPMTMVQLNVNVVF